VSVIDLVGERDASSLLSVLVARVRDELSMPFLPTASALLGELRS
jgi:hypothetical protein